MSPGRQERREPVLRVAAVAGLKIQVDVAELRVRTPLRADTGNAVGFVLAAAGGAAGRPLPGELGVHDGEHAAVTDQQEHGPDDGAADPDKPSAARATPWLAALRLRIDGRLVVGQYLILNGWQFVAIKNCPANHHTSARSPALALQGVTARRCS